MNKEQIQSTDAWKYISSLNNTQRYTALFGKMQSQTQDYFECKIKEYPFTELNKIPKEYPYMSVIDPVRNITFIAVLELNKK